MRFIRMALIAVTATLSSYTLAQTDALYLQDYLITEEPFPGSGVQVGRAWQKRLAQPIQSSCVVGVEKSYESNRSELLFHETFDREQVARALKASAKASYGVASGSGKFTKDVNIDRSKQNILAVLTVEKGVKSIEPQTADKLKLAPFAEAILKGGGKPAERLAAFEKQCGDAFVSSISIGGRLTAMFKADHSSETIKESFKAKAGGSFGRFSAKASLTTAQRTELTKNSTEVIYSQDGGPLSTPTTANDLLQKLQSFSTANGAAWSSQIIMLTPYRSLPDWPLDMKDVGVRESELQALAAHQKRLSQLAELYSDAALNPAKYYFPFDETPDANRAAERASGLYGASACLEALVEQCSVNSACDTTVLTSVERAAKFCNVDGLLDDQEKAGLYAAIAKEVELKAQTGTLSGLAKKVRDWVAGGAEASYEAEPVWSMYDTYYKVLATAPMLRSGTDVPKDEAYQVLLFCEAQGRPDCGSLSRNSAATVADAKKLSDGYRTWVVGNRLAPLAGLFCATSARDPMCKTPAELLAWSKSLSLTFGPSRNFTADATATPIVQATVKRTKPKYIRVMGVKILVR